MKNSPSKLWKNLFFLAAIFNCTAGGLGMLFPAIGFKVVTGQEITDPAVIFVFFMLCFVVALFGFGYALVACNAATNRGLAVIGAVGKLCFFAMAWYGYLNGLSSLLFAVVTIGDLIWAILFIYYLRTSKNTLAVS